MRRTRWIIALVILAVLVGGGYVAYQRLRPAAAQGPQRFVPGRVVRADLKQTVSGTAPIGPTQFQWVKGNVAGTIVETRVNEGDQVKKGQVLLVLTNDQTLNAAAQSRQDLLQAQLNLDSALNPTQTAIDSARLKVEQAKITLSNRQADVDNLTVTSPFAGVITAVKALVGDSPNSGTVVAHLHDDRQLQVTFSVPQGIVSQVRIGQHATLSIAGVGEQTGRVSLISVIATGAGREAQVPVTVELDKPDGVRPGLATTVSVDVGEGNSPVLGSGFVAAAREIDIKTRVAGTYTRVAVREGDHVKAGEMVAELESNTVRNALLTAEGDLQSAQNNLANLLDPTRDPGTSLESLRARVTSAQLTLANREQDVRDLTVYATSDGTVSGISALHPGDKISPNQQLVRILDYASLQVVIPVDELDIAKVKVGQPATIVFDALPGKQYTGKVSRIAPEGTVRNDIATFDVWVAIDTKPELKAGMNAQVSIVVETRTGVLAVPVDAVKRDNQGAYIMKPVGVQLGAARPVGGAAGNGAAAGNGTPATGGGRQGGAAAGGNGAAGGAAAAIPTAERIDRIRVQTGITDSTNVEIVRVQGNGELNPDDVVVLALITTGTSTQQGFRLPGIGGGGLGGPGGFGGGGGGNQPGGQPVRQTPTGQQRQGG